MPRKNKLQETSSLGGVARAAQLSEERRREIAREAAKTRWDAYRARTGTAAPTRKRRSTRG